MREFPELRVGRFVNPPMHWWEVDAGVRLAGDSWGDPADPPVVLLHGGGQSRHTWKDTGPRLAAVGRYAVAVDQRGHGDSSWSPIGDYSIDAVASDVARLLAHLGTEGSVLVGASLGGLASLAAVGEQALKVGGLVLVDIALRPQEEGIDKILAFMKARPEGYASLEEMAEAIAAFRNGRTRPISSATLAQKTRRTPDGRYHWHWDPRVLEFSDSLPDRERRLAACAQRVQVPTLLVRGGSSDVVSPADLATFQSFFDHATVVEVAGAEHMVVGDRNDIFSEALLTFLHDLS